MNNYTNSILGDKGYNDKEIEVKKLLESQRIEKVQFLIQQDKAREELHNKYEKRLNEIQAEFEKVEWNRKDDVDTVENMRKDLSEQHSQELKEIENEIEKSKLRMAKTQDQYEKILYENDMKFKEYQIDLARERHRVEEESLENELAKIKEWDNEFYEQEQKKLLKEREVVAREYELVDAKHEESLSKGRELLEMKQKKELQDTIENREKIDNRGDNRDDQERNNDSEKKGRSFDSES